MRTLNSFCFILLIMSFANPIVAGSLTLFQLISWLFISSFSSKDHEQFFLELLRFSSVLTSNEKAFSFWSFLLQEFETGFGFIAFGKENNESRIFINRFFLTILLLPESKLIKVFCYLRLVNWSLVSGRCGKRCRWAALSISFLAVPARRSISKTCGDHCYSNRLPRSGSITLTRRSLRIVSRPFLDVLPKLVHRQSSVSPDMMERRIFFSATNIYICQTKEMNHRWHPLPTDGTSLGPSSVEDSQLRQLHPCIFS